MDPKSQNTLALHFSTLHHPSQPLILSNIWDPISASTIASLPSTLALATASYAIAAAAGVSDECLTLAQNLNAVRGIAKVAAEHNLPLSVDMQDGYGAQLEEGIRGIIGLGAVGCNIEDFGRELGGGEGGMYSVEEACGRIRRVMSVAKEMGVPNFVLNARTDALFTPYQDSPPSLNAALTRAKAYLAAGAFNIFIWGGPSRQGWSRADVERATRELGGRLNVLLVRMAPGGLSVRELGEIGVCRISLGPQIMLGMRGWLEGEVRGILEGRGVGE